MKRILFISHNESNGSQLTWDFMRFNGVILEKVEPLAGEILQDDPAGFDAVITMGSPMTTWVSEFLEQQLSFLRHAIYRNIPVLGISSGAGILAQACGVPVRKSESTKIGLPSICLTDEGRRDILFYGLPRRMRFFQSRNDSLEMPYGAVQLATSRDCSVQAFRYRNAYGLRFHVDVSPGMVRDWVTTMPDREKNIRFYETFESVVQGQARAIYGNFLWLVDICMAC